MESYIILEAMEPETLELKVREAIQKGMVPLGGVSVIPETFWTHLTYHQAMVRPEALQTYQPTAPKA